jgi:hypothetical protein
LELNDNDYCTAGYADDIATLINRHYPRTVSEVLQTALCIVQQGFDATNLYINPNTTVIVPFTRILFSNTLQLTNEVKYLGLTSDKGSICKKQLHKVTKAYRAFWACRGTFGKPWGLQPKVMYWIYHRGCKNHRHLCWVKLRTSRVELSRLQRMVCLGTTGAMRAVPRAATEILPLGQVISDCTSISYKFKDTQGNINF